MAVNVNVQETSDGKFSVTVVASLNSFFSKFCCSRELTEPDKVEAGIFKLLQ